MFLSILKEHGIDADITFQFQTQNQINW
jgi:hypothetical protein